jgi:Domain of unknown function (DU1801)
MGTAATTPEQYIDDLEEPRRGDIRQLHELIRKTVPKLEPYMEHGMIGYGRFHYRYASGREGDTCTIGLASNKRSIALHLIATDAAGNYLAESYRDRLPKADIGKSCIRFKRLEDVDETVLREMIREAAKRPAGAAS